MGKLNAALLRYLTYEDIAILEGVELGMRNHELVSASLAASLAKLQCGGTHKILKELCKHRLLAYERGKKFDGYRLTNDGYDYLALHKLTKKNVIASFGNQIGVGKESNIYLVANEEGDEFCLKLHRLGRVCFRKVTEKRDYHKHAKSLSWLYLSKLSATKEFAYMKALFDEGFPVPRPISFNRHCVVMELVQGTLLNNILELKNVEHVYEQLIEIIMRFASSGLIHGDFNEFNIMITEEENAVIIDFPQMLSTSHPDAEMYFNRDVNCIITFFKRRFGYESEIYPKFSDIDRTGSLDAKVHCTGFTREMAKQFDIETGIEKEESSDDEFDDKNIDEKLSNIHSEQFKEQKICEEFEKIDFKSESISHFYDEKEKDVLSSHGAISSDYTESESETCSDNNSVTSDVKARRAKIKKQLRRKQKKEAQRQCYAKGEASAVRRTRKQNINHIKDSTKFWNM
ncbi:serine/threonine-protein kinase rio2 [Harmonia axyridis]|uniref:serine/threonine-protein kinase rio2 n=1 Tax=Harmonia axyridis TaxID=115357 RepID=UPI001E277606|nr:serine/threonine-protein kinase rio2 [Harmonia axyridis]